MSHLVKKLTTANRALQAEGLGGLKSILSDKKQALYGRLYRSVCRSKWVWEDHWWIGKLVEIRGNRVILGGCEFGVNSPAILTSHKSRLFFDFVYEAPEREALERYLNPELPVVEFGASIGVIACLTNKKLRDPQRHVVVEANPDLLGLLKENRDRNGCSFSILHRAIAYGKDETAFHQNKDFLCSSVQLSSSKSVTVPTASFQEIVDALDYGHCTLICDIEGGENDLIEYELNLISTRVATLIIEIHEKVLGVESVKKNLLKLEQAGLILVCKKWETYVFQNRRINPV
jgi:FkbM family methyltransferase